MFAGHNVKHQQSLNNQGKRLDKRLNKNKYDLFCIVFCLHYLCTIIYIYLW